LKISRRELPEGSAFKAYFSRTPFVSLRKEMFSTFSVSEPLTYALKGGGFSSRSLRYSGVINPWQS